MWMNIQPHFKVQFPAGSLEAQPSCTLLLHWMFDLNGVHQRDSFNYFLLYKSSAWPVLLDPILSSAVVIAFSDALVSWMIVFLSEVSIVGQTQAGQGWRSRACWINKMWSTCACWVISQTPSSLLYDSGIMENRSVSPAITPLSHSSKPMLEPAERKIFIRSIFQEARSDMQFRHMHLIDNLSIAIIVYLWINRSDI